MKGGEGGKRWPGERFGTGRDLWALILKARTAVVGSRASASSFWRTSILPIQIVHAVRRGESGAGISLGFGFGCCYESCAGVT